MLHMRADAGMTPAEVVDFSIQLRATYGAPKEQDFGGTPGYAVTK